MLKYRNVKTQILADCAGGWQLERGQKIQKHKYKYKYKHKYKYKYYLQVQGVDIESIEGRRKVEKNLSSDQNQVEPLQEGNLIFVADVQNFICKKSFYLYKPLQDHCGDETKRQEYM